MAYESSSRNLRSFPFLRPFATAMTLICFGASMALAAQEGLPDDSVLEENGSEDTLENAGEAGSQEQFFDKVDVDLVNVDVMVTDRQGQPITGLKREDFTLYVDNEEVEVSNFFEVTATPGGNLGEKAPEETDIEQRSMDATEQLTLVVVIDNRNIRPENRNLLLHRLREHLADDSLADAQIMLTDLNRGLEVAVPFTADRERIFAALDQAEKQGSLATLLDSDRRIFLSRLQSAQLRSYQPQASNPRLSQRPGSDAQAGRGLTLEGDDAFDDVISLALKLATDVRHLAEKRYQQAKATTEDLGRLSETLGGLPGRKALLYLSDGLPERPADPLIQAWTDKYQNWALRNHSDFNKSSYPQADREFQRVINALGSSEFDLKREIRALTAQASANRVAFYPISNSGRNSDLISASLSGGAVGSGASGSSRGAQHLESFSRDATLLQLAEDTGGQALIRTANLGELLERAKRDFQSFYALGYSKPETEAKRSGKSRNIRVEVRRDNVFVRHGKTYRPRNWRDRLGAMTLASALFAVEDNAFGAALAPGDQVPEGKRYRVPIMLKIPFDQIRLVYRDDHFRAQLTALVVVRDEKDGGYSKAQRIDFPIKIPGRRIMEAAKHEAGYLLELEMEGGPKRISVGIRDHLAETESTVNLDLVVGKTL